MKNAFVKIMAVVLTLAAIVVAVGLFRPTSAQSQDKFKIDILLWDLSKDTDSYRVGLENGLDNDGGATITVDTTNKNVLHVETKLPTVGEQNPVLKLYKNKEGQTFTADEKNLIDGQVDKADLIAHVEFDKDEAKNWDKDTRVQLFEGVRPTLSNFNEHVPAKTYFVLDKENSNIFVVYFTPTELDEKLGTHAFGVVVNRSAWQIENENYFTFRVASELKGKKVAVSHIKTADPSKVGFIVLGTYGDPGKITGDITAAGNKFFKGEAHKNASQYVAVVGKGSPNTTNNNVYSVDRIPQAAIDTFRFDFVREKVTATGLAGTTAKDKKTVFVETTIAINFDATTQTEAGKITEERQNTVKQWFKIHEKDSETAVVEIAEVQTSFTEKSSASLVLVLNQELDNKKEYILEFNNKKQGADLQSASIDLSLDKEAPIIEFKGLKEGDKVKVEFNKEFDFQLIPKYTVTDDRDGNITESLYVPGADEKNEKRFIDPSIKGDYEVLFKVVDAWGNVTTQTVVFSVE